MQTLLVDPPLLIQQVEWEWERESGTGRGKTRESDHLLLHDQDTDVNSYAGKVKQSLVNDLQREWETTLGYTLCNMTCLLFLLLNTAVSVASGRNQPNQEILLPDWLITSQMIYITSSDRLFTKSDCFLPIEPAGSNSSSWTTWSLILI